MNETVSQADIDSATAYQQLMVPALFDEWAPRVADAARLGAGQRVLDVACGTGVLAREAAARTRPGGAVSGLDAGAGMLAVAQVLAPDITWRQGLAETLPYPNGAFDAVVSQFGLMFFGDRIRALQEMTRVLAPGGTWAVAVWDSLENTPAYAMEAALLEKMAGRAAADALSAPFSLGDRGELQQLFASAGLENMAIESITGTGRFPAVRVMVEADLRGWLPIMGVELEDDLIEDILRQAERELSPFVSADGMVVFDSPAHIISGSLSH